ncbi:sulfotransferase family 2 domain-containing protein [Burkholderia cenocepacia]|uniref:sulfotransferase family 2 domain-containing protein n=1 Tax=Burkholderia cenocepacia TaxID=95486 RepID=UPI00286478CF|nr:sulfotransferase family 2 domain-containing protein [Burkholderia cenocepacia]MDR8051201.1 sulfotransferase family 2 domain-containing protein [Burkholderia cenocepacia]
MVYSDALKFVFLHNPKSAGTSIRTALEPYDDSNGRYWHCTYSHQHARLVDQAHICASELAEHGLLDKVSSYFTFGFVRDPYTRFLSAWDEHRFQHRLSDQTDINEWIHTHLTSANVRYDWRYIHFCPQHFFFYSGRKCVADFIGRFEHIDDSWFAIQKLLGCSIPLGTANIKGGTEVRSLDSLTAESIHLINELYDRDFSLFGYTKYIDNASTAVHPVPTSYAEEVRNGLLPERVALRSMFEQNGAALAEREHALETLRNQLEESQTTLAQVRTELGISNTRLAELHVQVESTQAQLEATRLDAAAQAQSLETARHVAARNATALARTKSELDRVMHSKSMRYTSWLRKISHVFR